MTESLLLDKDDLAALAERFPIGIVTGRPRSDAAAFLERFDITEHFQTVVTRDDADLKPSPAPTRLAMDALGARTAWLVGDTPDDVVSARRAGALPIGVTPPSSNPAKDRAVAASLTAAGAGVVLERTALLIDPPCPPEDPMTANTPNRAAIVSRQTRETSIELRLDLDGTGEVSASTGIGFLDHMIDALGRHGRMDIDLKVTGDLEVDDHHTAEDCAIVLGTAIDKALGERRGIVRFSDACAPLDEALVRAVLDLSGRPWPEVHLDFKRESLGGLATENVPHFFRSLAIAGRFCLHLDLIRGENDHHKAEAAFKAFALAMNKAVRLDGSSAIPSTKGSL